MTKPAPISEGGLSSGPVGHEGAAGRAMQRWGCVMSAKRLGLFGSQWPVERGAGFEPAEAIRAQLELPT